MEKKDKAGREGDFVSIDSTEMKYSNPNQIPVIAKPLGEVIVSCFNICKGKIHSVYDVGERVEALKNICLDSESGFYPIKQGEFVIIRGPSGGGKTTLLNIIGAIDKASSGSVELFGHVVDASSGDRELSRIRLETIGFVFQTFNLIATMTAEENVELPMTLLGKLKPKDRKLRARMLLAQVGLQDRNGHLPSELSGGEQQRVAIARALSNSPKILLLDEPTGDLDTRSTVEVMNLLLKINQETQTTCIMVTHNPDLESYADRILYVQDGEFKFQAVNTSQSALDYESYMAYIDLNV